MTHVIDHKDERINNLLLAFDCVTNLQTRGDTVILYVGVRDLQLSGTTQSRGGNVLYVVSIMLVYEGN